MPINNIFFYFQKILLSIYLLPILGEKSDNFWKNNLANSRKFSQLNNLIFIDFLKWVPDRVPISPKGIRGPAGARKRKNNHDVEPSKKSPANLGLNRE